MRFTPYRLQQYYFIRSKTIQSGHCADLSSFALGFKYQYINYKKISNIGRVLICLLNNLRKVFSICKLALFYEITILTLVCLL